MQALPCAASGRLASSSALKVCDTHQHGGWAWLCLEAMVLNLAMFAVAWTLRLFEVWGR